MNALTDAGKLVSVRISSITQCTFDDSICADETKAQICCQIQARKNPAADRLKYGCKGHSGTLHFFIRTVTVVTSNVSVNLNAYISVDCAVRVV